MSLLNTYGKPNIFDDNQDTVKYVLSILCESHTHCACSICIVALNVKEE